MSGEARTLERSEPVRRFVARARAFCALLEGGELLSASAFAVEAASRLFGLYEAASRLPAAVPPVVCPACEHDVPPELVARVRRGVSDKLGRHHHYWEVYDPFEADEPVAFSLCDDLADVYVDLKRGLATLDVGSEPETVWQWRFDFRSHWGRHLVGALRALHALISDDRLPET